jgi:hypothetical protein
MDDHKRVEAAIERGLYPMVRLLIEYGVSESSFAQIARSVFVKVAAETIENGPAELGNKATATRIAVMTGIPRGAINPILNSQTVIAQDEWYRHLCSDVLNAWHNTPEYLDKKGAPIAIPFSGSAPSFEALVAKQEEKRRSDVSPHAILDELKLVGCVEELPVTSDDPESDTLLYARHKNFRRVGSQIEDLEAAMDGLYNYVSSKHEVMINHSQQVMAQELFNLHANPKNAHLLLNAFRKAGDSAIGSARTAMSLPQHQLDADDGDGTRVGIGVYVYSEDQMKKSRFFATTIDEAEDKKLANE